MRASARQWVLRPSYDISVPSVPAGLLLIEGDRTAALDLVKLLEARLQTHSTAYAFLLRGRR